MLYLTENKDEINCSTSSEGQAEGQRTKEMVYRKEKTFRGKYEVAESGRGQQTKEMQA